MVCDASTVVASSPCRTGLCPVFLCLLTCRLLVMFKWLDLHLPRILCQGSSSVLAGSPRPSRSDYGVRVAFFHHQWKPLSCALGLFRRLIVHDWPTRVASPFLFPHPESQGGLLNCVSHSLSRPGALHFLSFLSSNVGWFES